MVEFGLKLEDNKVAEWSEHYIRYERLKSVLKKCQHALERYNTLHAKRPEVASKVEEAYRKGLPTPGSSRIDLTALAEPTNTSVTSSPSSQQQQPPPSSMDREDSALLSSQHAAGGGDSSSYHSITSSVRRSESTGVLSRVIETATSGVSEYFQKSYERQVKDALSLVDKRTMEFEKDLLTDIQTVNDFYQKLVDETNGRLLVLKESVAALNRSTSNLSSTTSGPEDDEEDIKGKDESYLETPLVQNSRKRPTTIALAVASIKRQLHKRPGPNNGVDDQQVVAPLLSVDEDDYNSNSNMLPSSLAEERARRLREADSIQRSLEDMYRRSKLLQNFAIINYTGFVKIVKKHDKTLREHKGRYKEIIKPDKICNEGKDIEALTEHMERLYANWFCERNLSVARHQLLSKKGDGLEMDWSQMRLGYRMGMCAVLGLWVCWDCIWGMVSKGTSTIGGRTAFPVFRAVGGLLLLQWFWGCSVWVWSRFRVNYIFLFDFNPTVVATPLAIFDEAVDNSLAFLVGMLLYYKAGAHDVPGDFPAGIFPLLLVIYTTYRLIFPLRVRGPMWVSIWEVITSPMTSPTFFHGYVGDIFTSMVKVFQDLAWTACFVLTGDWMISEDLEESHVHLWSKSTWYSKILIPILTLLPLWFRFNQCLRRYTDTGQRLPNLANAFKYALSMTVTLFGAFHPLYLMTNGDQKLFQLFWMLTFVSSSLYSFFWDVYMDWGLGRPQFGFLGPRLMYPKKVYYYSVIAVDLVLRFAWVLTLIPPNSGASFALPQYLTAVSMMFELFRRTVWGFFRLENEHRSNTSGYRRVDFVPLHFSTGHRHGYKEEKEHRGYSVLVEVAVVTLLVLAAAVASIVAAQHETENVEGEL